MFVSLPLGIDWSTMDWTPVLYSKALLKLEKQLLRRKTKKEIETDENFEPEEFMISLDREIFPTPHCKKLLLLLQLV